MFKFEGTHRVRQLLHDDDLTVILWPKDTPVPTTRSLPEARVAAFVQSIYETQVGTKLPEWRSPKEIVFSSVIIHDKSPEGAELFTYVEQIKDAVANVFKQQGVTVTHENHLIDAGDKDAIAIAIKHGYKHAGKSGPADAGNTMAFIKAYPGTTELESLNPMQRRLANLLITRLKQTSPND